MLVLSPRLIELVFLLLDSINGPTLSSGPFQRFQASATARTELVDAAFRVDTSSAPWIWSVVLKQGSTSIASGNATGLAFSTASSIQIAFSSPVTLVPGATYDVYLQCFGTGCSAAHVAVSAYLSSGSVLHFGSFSFRAATLHPAQQVGRTEFVNYSV